MAKKEKVNLADMSVEDLKQSIADEKSQLKKIKFNHTVTPLENPMQMRELRRKVARLLTEENKRKTAR
ncbi:MAG: 50S ribosomal protein L29 [Bacteroidota bacterium]|jgi:large subunit ribosomal protein L29